MDVQEYLNQWTSQPVGYNTRDLLLYAVGIGASDLRFIYENDGDFAAFPTFPIVLNFSGVEEDVVPFPSEALSQGPNFPPLEGTRFVLDGERFIEQLNPLPTEGAALTLKQRLIGVHKRGSGALVETEAILLDEKTGKE